MEPINRICIKCNQEFLIKKERDINKKYCSAVCYRPPKVIIEKTCEQCKKSYKISVSSKKPKDSKFCSKLCHTESQKRYLTDNDYETIRCSECLKDFKLPKEYIAKRKNTQHGFFCSRSCSSISSNKNRYEKKFFKCQNCGIEKIVTETYFNGHGKYCSQKCYHEHDRERLAELARKIGRDSAQKISEHHKEFYKNPENHPFFGKQLTEEHKKNISETRIERGSGAGERNSMFGKHHTEKSRAAMSDTRTRKWVNGEYENIWKRGSYYSNKMNQKINYKYSYEERYFKFLENNEKVKQYFIEKLRISYYDT